MKQSTKKVLFWSPRVLCILFALFTSIFALDVFDEGHSFWHTLLALTMHLIPTGILILVLIISWRWEWVGGVLFLAFSVLYVFWAWGIFPLSVYVTICGPMILICILFFINWKYKSALQNR